MPYNTPPPPKRRDSVTRLSLGKLLVNLLKVVKRTNIPLIPQQMASSAGQKEKLMEKPPKPRGRPSGHYEQPKNKDTKLITPKNEELSRSGGGLKVNWSRTRLEIRLRYVRFPEEAHWRCELASAKSLIRLPSKSCSAPGEEEV